MEHTQIQNPEDPPPTVLSGLPAELRNHPKYHVLEHVGEGGMGTVYLAEHRRLKRKEAIKIIRPEFHFSEALLERFPREAEAMARVEHPNLVKVHDFEQVGPLMILSMEWVAGGSWQNYLKQHELSVGEIVDSILQISRGVQALHREGIVHRDLKPGNILRTLDGTLKVTDFGLAKMLVTDSRTEKQPEPLTRPGGVMGTPEYMSPEQHRDSSNIGRETDLWAIGVILYFALTRRFPFRGETYQDTAILVATTNPTPFDPSDTRIPGTLQSICLRLLEKDPRKRYSIAQVLIDDLERFRSPSSSRSRPPLGKWLAIGVAAGLLIGGSWLLSRPATPDQQDAIVGRKSPEQSIEPRERSLKVIVADLASLPREKRESARYLGFDHLDPKRREEFLAAWKDFDAWMNHLGNSLAWTALPDADVFRIDVDRFRQPPIGEEFSRLFRRYPYGLSFAPPLTTPVADLQSEFSREVTHLPMSIRGDWLLIQLTAKLREGEAEKRFGVPLAGPPKSVDELEKSYLSGTVFLSDVATEFGIPAAKIEELLRTEPRLTRLGLRPWLEGKAISRAVWESLEFGSSPYQELSRELGLGTPLILD
jgi:serine/threonine protein kinase